MTEALNIDVISDVVCPWCFVGKRRLEAALALYAQKHPDRPAPVVQWHPYQLNPDLPREGIPRKEYIAQKFGGRPYPNERLESVGAPLGIAFAFDKMLRQPNTLAAHSLIARAARATTRAPRTQTRSAGSQAQSWWPRRAASRIIEKVVSL